MPAKAPNYTEAQTAAIVADYQAGKTVEAIAEATSRAVKSVRAKLVREGVYKAPEKAPAAPKDEGPTKKDLLATLGNLGFSDLDGIQNATKAALQAVIDMLQAGADSVAEDQAA